ncbi:MAG: right-handed parallel beta-helix repeat-containing protein, partial [Planctomycetota bacterium]
MPTREKENPGRLYLIAICVLLHIAMVGSLCAADFVVSTTGDDNNPGTKEKPFSTIEKARDVVRREIAHGLKSNITVFLRGGKYQLEKPFVLGLEDSGNEQFSITYAAYPTETPVISGGRKITGWEKGQNNIWTTYIPEVKNGKWWFRQLFADGNRLTRARFPNNDANLLRLKTVSEDIREFELDQPIPAGNLAGSDAEMVVMQSWSIARSPVVSSKNNTVQTATSMGWVGKAKFLRLVNAVPGKPAYLEHALAFLDLPGEWYLQRKTGTLYYKSADGENPNQMNFTAPKLKQLLVIEGGKDKPVRNVHFRGIDFAYAGWQMPSMGYSGIQACHHGTKYIEEPTYAVPLTIYLGYAHDCSFRLCTLKHIGASGLGLAAGCQRNKIIGCEFYDIGANGVMTSWRAKEDRLPRRWFENDWKDPNDAPRDNEISNCFVHDCGTVLFGAHGIFDAFAQNTKISHNLLTDLPYSAISIGFVWNTIEPSSQKGARVEYNHIYNVQTKLADGGGIYTLGYQPGAVIVGNLIHDMKRSPYAYGAANNGIFFDESSKGFHLERNIIYNIPAVKGNIIKFNQVSFGKSFKEYHTWKDNYFGVKPTDLNFPWHYAAQAGLEPAYRDKLIKI